LKEKIFLRSEQVEAVARARHVVAEDVTLVSGKLVNAKVV